METSQTAAAFAALSQETRLDLIRLLIAEGATGLPAGEIAERLAVPSSTLSFHLAALERAGLTHSTRQGKHVIHAVRIAGLRQLLAFLAETCCGGRPNLYGDIARLLPPLPDEDKGMTPAFNVLFLCTQNSARSQIPAAIHAERLGYSFTLFGCVGPTQVTGRNDRRSRGTEFREVLQKRRDVHPADLWLAQEQAIEPVRLPHPVRAPEEEFGKRGAAHPAAHLA